MESIKFREHLMSLVSSRRVFTKHNVIRDIAFPSSRVYALHVAGSVNFEAV